MYVALLFHKFEFESESQCDQEGRIRFHVASPWLFQMHQDFDKLFSVVDDLSLDANVIDQRFGAMFSKHEPDTQMYEAISHLAHFGLHSTRPIF